MHDTTPTLRITCVHSHSCIVAAPTEAVLFEHAGKHSVGYTRRARKNLSLSEDAAAQEALAGAEATDAASGGEQVEIPIEADADNGVLVGKIESAGMSYSFLYILCSYSTLLHTTQHSPVARLLGVHWCAGCI